MGEPVQEGWEAKAATLSFEEAMAQLEEVVARLEGEPLPLEEAERLYLWGRALAARCRQLLDEAELRLEEIGAEAPA